MTDPGDGVASDADPISDDAIDADPISDDAIDADPIDDDALPDGALVLHGSAQVADTDRNTFGIVEANPDPDDPAIAVAIGIAHTGERIGRILRLGDHVTDGGLDLRVLECRTGDEPELVLVPANASA